MLSQGCPLSGFSVILLPTERPGTSLHQSWSVNYFLRINGRMSIFPEVPPLKYFRKEQACVWQNVLFLKAQASSEHLQTSTPIRQALIKQALGAGPPLLMSKASRSPTPTPRHLSASLRAVEAASVGFKLCSPLLHGPSHP